MSEAEPLTPMAESAAMAHELFTTFVAGGFTEDQAFELVARVLVAQIQKG